MTKPKQDNTGVIINNDHTIFDWQWIKFWRPQPVAVCDYCRKMGATGALTFNTPNRAMAFSICDPCRQDWKKTLSAAKHTDELLPKDVKP